MRACQCSTPTAASSRAGPSPRAAASRSPPTNTVYISDVNAGIVNIVKDGKRIDSVAADRAHGMGIDADGSIYVSGASRMTVMKISLEKWVFASCMFTVS